MQAEKFIMGARRISLAAILPLLLICVPHNAYSLSLDDLIGGRPVILLFAKSRSDSALDKEVALFSERRPELAERQAVVVMITERHDAIAVVGYVSLSAGTGRLLRNKYQPADGGLSVILVGKNGQELQRWRGVVSPDEVFDQIDKEPEAEHGDDVTIGG